MRKLRFILALIIAFIRRFKVILLISIVVGIVLFLLATYVLPSTLQKDTDYIGVVGRFHIDELPTSVLNSIGEGLTKIDDSGKAVPALASSWEALDSGKTWKFNIDTTRRWSDGSVVDANSISYSFEDVAIERPDDKTIVFKLQNAYAPFPLVVSHPVFKRGLVGTGSWRVQNISVSNTFVDELELVNSEGLRRLLRFYPSEEAAKTAFQLGQVDQLESILDPQPLASWNTANTEAKVEDTRYVAIFLNTRSAVFKDNKPLRQALSYAIDKTAWGGDIRALGPIPTRSWGYSPQVKPYDYDVTRARELLEDILPKEGTLTVKLTTNPTLLPLAEQIAEDWKEVGVIAEIQASSSLSEEYDAYLALYEVSLDPDQYLTWHSTQETTNVTHLSNQRIDKLLEDGRLEMDEAKRKKIYLDFQRFLLEEAPAIFLYHPSSYTITRK